ncbi:hypothetical protein [Duganella sp. P38]|jgi:hypothetical protein|uniref:hypothetical protein n=1 Tax=Duganella sp. P38 TaxID=3423949 RepID=UPI003D795C08
MKLTHAADYSTRVITPSASDTIPKSEILIASVPTGIIIDGAVFEAALRWHDYTLLFLTDDVPFEDTLNIYLLDAALSIVDWARMYFMYSTGIFSNLDLTQKNTVRFCFFAEKTWVLKLFPEKIFALPLISDPIGVSRPLKFFRMFQLDSNPLPQISQTVALGSA